MLENERELESARLRELHAAEQFAKERRAFHKQSAEMHQQQQTTIQAISAVFTAVVDQTAASENFRNDANMEKSDMACRLSTAEGLRRELRATIRQNNSDLRSTATEAGEHRRLVKKISERLECAICHATMSDPICTACGHAFCKECLTIWYSQDSQKRHRTCPLCRKQVGVPHSPNIALKSIAHDTVAALAHESQNFQPGGVRQQKAHNEDDHLLLGCGEFEDIIEMLD